MAILAKNITSSALQLNFELEGSATTLNNVVRGIVFAMLPVSRTCHSEAQINSENLSSNSQGSM